MFEKTYFRHFLNANELDFSGQVVNNMLCSCTKERPTLVPIEHIDMLDDIEYFLTYSWGTLSYHTTIKSMCGCLARRSNASHTYNITGFPLAFMVYGYESISSLAKTFEIKSLTSICPRMLNWTITGMTNKNKLNDIFGRRGLHEVPLIATVHHARGRKPSNIASVVEGEPDVHDHIDRGTSVEVRLYVMEEKISSINSRLSCMDNILSSIDSRLSSMESKLDCLIKLFSSTYNTTRVQGTMTMISVSIKLKVEDERGVGVDDAHRTCDRRIDHATYHLVPPVSILSSPIMESEHSVQVFTQISDRKLAGGRRKRRCEKTIESPYDCQSLCRKMIRTLPVFGSVKFDLYCPVPDEVAQQYEHFIDTSVDDQTVELFWITVGKDYLKDMKCSPNWLTGDQYMEARLDFFNENRENYKFGEEILEFLNEREPVMNIKPCASYDRIWRIHQILRADLVDPPYPMVESGVQY
ncbi:hypothetical protein FNV43_RR06614 [Rhamnella rubrinervis]|uniref:Uncharacterized protein n=1 Tax=Rhamnella rubrinervis TaxID=2594499 RepID=A0A8K0MLK1_9ROSA|nr:hypothetical protein FNV43_RR06614 [Rhamnella rubrinervis]